MSQRFSFIEVLNSFIETHDMDDSDVYSACLIVAATLAHKFEYCANEFSDDAILTMESIKSQVKR